MLRTAAVIAASVTLLLAGRTTTARPTRILPNDNTRPAGTLANGVLTVALETRVGSWQPDGEGGKALDSLFAFAEPGKAPSTPGPLIRVPVGTRVRGTMRNTLDRPLTLLGLGRTRAPSDSIVVPAGKAMPFEFSADRPGTYLYFAHSVVAGPFRDAREMQLNGVIVVDGPGTPPDRILTLSMHFVIDTTSGNGVRGATMAINGLSWPHTERFTYAQGDSVRWRVVNFTEADHPMHLHGFYFRVDGVSADGVDTAYAPEQRRMAVTQIVEPFQAFDLAWQAARPGNWVFHCHYAVHISNYVTLDTKGGVLDSSAAAHHHSDRPHQMFGLVAGITVTPGGAAAAVAAPDRVLRIEQRERSRVYGDQPGLSFVASEGGKSLVPDSMPVPGPMLVLERGKRVQVTIVNRSEEQAAVHWHGIELESYPDGVPGWSGAGKAVLPAIAPHDSLTVSWTPPRAGSFMYHSHFNEARQMGGGLYGPIVVLEPGERYDPATDRVFFFGTAGYLVNFLKEPPGVLLNGRADPDAMELRVGTRYRFRFFNLAGDDPTLVSLTQGGVPVRWRAVAKDGYPLPPSQATEQRATLRFDPGEIYDFEFTPLQAGELVLGFGRPQPAGAPPPATMAMHVR